MRKQLVYYVLLAVLVAFTSCKAPAVAGGVANKRAKASSVSKAHEERSLQFNTIKSRLGINYKDDNQSVSATLDLRMERDQHIWMSARFLGITVAKVHITPDRVQFYEIKDKRYFDGDFALISKFLGQPLNFTQMQDLLLGQAVENLDNKKLTVVNNEYQFTAQDFVKKLFKLRPSDFKLAEQSVYHPTDGSYLEIKYPEYQNVDGRILPREISIDAKRGSSFSKVELEFKSVNFDEVVRFPFKIPSGYKKMEL
ncbi:MAG: DUF4292 domain-containing protein [Nonlabens sp.]